MTQDTEAGPLDDLMPIDPLMVPPWASCLMWAIGRDDIMAAFQEDTGTVWKPPANGLERMIYEATGADLARVRAFVEWFNANVWGDLDLKAGSEWDWSQEGDCRHDGR